MKLEAWSNHGSEGNQGKRKVKKLDPNFKFLIFDEMNDLMMIIACFEF